MLSNKWAHRKKKLANTDKKWPWLLFYRSRNLRMLQTRRPDSTFFTFLSESIVSSYCGCSEEGGNIGLCLSLLTTVANLH